MVTSTKPLIGSNVTKMTIESVHSDIMSFLKRKNIGNGDKLQGTASEYQRDINRFFQVMLNKTTIQLTIKDLDIIKRDVESFQTFLIDNGYKSGTVNRNINTMRALYGYFQENRYRYKDNDNEWVYITSTPFHVDAIELNDEQTYGMFTHEEITKMIELAKELPNGIKKSLAIEFASKTAFRIEAVASLNKSDIRKEGNVYVVKTIDKKKVHEKPINQELYNRLMEDALEDGSIFDFSKKTLERAINELTEKMELDPDRNLTFHSIKKYSMGEVYHITNGDTLAVAKHGNHSSFETSMKYYLLFANQYETNPCLSIGEEIDTRPLQDMSKEEIIALIEKSSRALQYELLHTLSAKDK